MNLKTTPDDRTTITYCHPRVGVCLRIDLISVKGTALIVYKFLSVINQELINTCTQNSHIILQITTTGIQPFSESGAFELCPLYGIHV